MRHLFIQDSESPRTLKKLVIVVVGILITLAISDWLLGRILPLFTIEPPFIMRFENVPGVEALWRYSEAGIKPVIFTGSSQVYTGISPHIFDDRVKTISGHEVQSVNASVLASVITIERDLIRNLFIPNHPQVIIYGIEMRAVKTEWLSEDFFSLSDFKNKAVGYAVTRESIFERDLLLWLLQHSNWARYRDNMREWLTGSREINQGANGYISGGVDDRGYAPFPNTPSQNTDNKGQFVPFSVADSTRQMMIDLGTTCKQSGVQCILLNMPLHQISYQFITDEEETQYRQLIQEAKLPIWDFNTPACRTELGDASFFNMNHLNSAGAVVFSEMLAGVYAQVFFNIPVSGNASCATLSPN
jgi:hypothetical protein